MRDSDHLPSDMHAEVTYRHVNESWYDPTPKHLSLAQSSLHGLGKEEWIPHALHAIPGRNMRQAVKRERIYAYQDLPIIRTDRLGRDRGRVP